jgi:hypothetical protein
MRSSAFLALGHEIAETVSQSAAVWQGKPPDMAIFRAPSDTL